MSAPSSMPVSPASSKRSRSKDSARSATVPPTHHPTNHPAASTPALLPPLTLAAELNHATANAPHHQHSPPDPTPYPAFLRPPNAPAQLDAKWNDLEWAQMNRLREGLTPPDAQEPVQWARCTGDPFAPRNRYVNVDPYQANRVRLDVPDDANDYINASPIELASTTTGAPLTYIATQGPKADSWSHLWRMLWNHTHSPAVIVMVTKTHEQSREKCFPYYPLSLADPVLRANQHDEFGDGFIHDLHLRTLQHDHDARTEVREIDMTTLDAAESRKIWHLLFEGWPDFSVPEGHDKAALLNMIRLSRHYNADNATNPRIVHCSAGIGRSGTFIALDWLMQELDEGALDHLADDADPVVAVIESLRDQRPMMVQSKQQFLFIYDTLREQWRNRWIARHPDEARQLGIQPSSDEPEPVAVEPVEPALKRQKSNADAPSDEPPLTDEERAKLEAELMGADYE